MGKNIKIIGSGFSSLAASCYLAQKGHKVTVFEKNNSIGGRARQFKKEGFTFDMNPTGIFTLMSVLKNANVNLEQLKPLQQLIAK